VRRSDAAGTHNGQLLIAGRLITNAADAITGRSCTQSNRHVAALAQQPRLEASRPGSGDLHRYPCLRSGLG